MNTNIDQRSKNNAGHIRRLFEGSDIRVCEDCGRKGDRRDIEMHRCKKYNVCHFSEVTSAKVRKVEWL
jgi:hypothetical protein